MSPNNDMSAELTTAQAAIVKDFEALRNGKAGARETLMHDLKKALHVLQTPSEYIMNNAFAVPATNTCIHTCLNLGVIQRLGAETSKEKSLSLDDLAKAAHAARDLLSRFLKHLAAMLVVDETGHEMYCANELTRGLAVPTVGNGIIGVTQTSGASFLRMADYLRENGYRNPVNVGDNGPFQYANGTKKNIYDWMVDENPRAGAAFMSYMVGNRTCANHWTEEGFYPVQEKLAHSEITDTAPLIVDVGGGMGQDMMLASVACEGLPGRFVVQDAESVIREAGGSGLHLDPRIELRAHDFFKPQPEEFRGARAYHMHHVLHCWDEDRCVKILNNVREAMRPGYSKLLLFEDVVPEISADWKMTSMDILMIAENGTTERTEKQWDDLMLKAGLRIDSVYTKNKYTESLIEVVLDDKRNRFLSNGV